MSSTTNKLPAPATPVAPLPSLTQSRHAMVLTDARQLWKRAEEHEKESRDLRAESDLETARADCSKRAAHIRLSRAGVRRYIIRTPEPLRDLATTDAEFAQAVWAEIVKATGSPDEANEHEFVFREEELDHSQMVRLLADKETPEAPVKLARDIIKKAYLCVRVVYVVHIDATDFDFYVPFETKAEAEACIEPLKTVDLRGREAQYLVEDAQFDYLNENIVKMYGKSTDEIVKEFGSWMARRQQREAKQ